MITKTTMVVVFNLQNSHLLTLSLPTEEAFHINGQNRPVANLPAVDFHLISFSILVFFAFLESLNLTVCQRFVFFSVLAAIIRESSDKQLVLRIVKTLPFIHKPDSEAPKASDALAADWLYQDT